MVNLVRQGTRLINRIAQHKQKNKRNVLYIDTIRLKILELKIKKVFNQ